MITTAIILGIIAFFVLMVIALYNRLVGQRALVREAFSGITVQLRRRADLIPNLVEAVKGYATHERATLEEVTRQRGAAVAGGSVQETAAADAQMTGLLGRPFGRHLPGRLGRVVLLRGWLQPRGLQEHQEPRHRLEVRPVAL